MSFVPSTKIAVKFLTVPPGPGHFPQLYYRQHEKSPILASINAGNSDLLYVSGGGVNQVFHDNELVPAGQTKADNDDHIDDYQDRHQKLAAKAGEGGTAFETYQDTNPMAFSYVRATKLDKSIKNWYAGVCFMDVFDSKLCPRGNSANAAMLYAAPPKASYYPPYPAPPDEFLAAITATASYIIKTVADYNALAPKHSLPIIGALRSCLFSSAIYNRDKPHRVPLNDIARAIFAGFSSELQASDSGLTELQLPVSTDHDNPLFAAVQSDLAST